MQTSPWLRAKRTAPSTALSRNSSSLSQTEEKKMLGDLPGGGGEGWACGGGSPPSSSVVGMSFSAAHWRILVPVAVEPVKPSLAMPSLLASAAPASLP